MFRDFLMNYGRDWLKFLSRGDMIDTYDQDERKTKYINQYMNKYIFITSPDIAATIIYGRVTDIMWQEDSFGKLAIVHLDLHFIYHLIQNCS
jgi:hypothetical protein